MGSKLGQGSKGIHLWGWHGLDMSVGLSACMYISYKDHNNSIPPFSVNVMTQVIALEAGQSSQGTSEPITPVIYCF